MKIERQQLYPPLPKSTCDLLWLSEARYRAIVEDQTELICRTDFMFRKIMTAIKNTPFFCFCTEQVTEAMIT